MSIMEIPSYQHPLKSSLEEFRTEIAELRKAEWPYRKIEEWLSENKGAKFHHTTLISFCKVRKIVKGRGETRRPGDSRRAPVTRVQPTEPGSGMLDRADHTLKKLDGDDFDFGA